MVEDLFTDLFPFKQLLPITMSLATLRAHIWKGGNDIVLHYKANGRKEIPFPPADAVEATGGVGGDETRTGVGQHLDQQTSPTAGGQVGSPVTAAA